MLSNLSLGNPRTSLIGMLAAAFGISSCGTNPPAEDWAGLSSKDVGQYAAVPWLAPGAAIEPGSYWDRVSGLNFVVAKQQLTDDLDDAYLDYWVEAALNGAEQEKKLLLSLNFWDGADRYQGEMQSVDVYWNRLQQFLDGMQSQGALDALQGLVLAEENVYYNGRPQLLTELYQRIKQNYDIAVWQWWSPTLDLPSNGGWIPADGWVTDNYFMANPEFRQYVRKYVVTGKPVVVMPWATSELALFPPMTDAQWQANNEQLAVALEFDLPVAFYWTLNGTCWFGADPAQPTDDEIGKMNQWVWNYIQQVQNLPTDYSGEATADTGTADPLNFADFMSGGRLQYSDNFVAQKCIDDAAISGFRDLVMDGQTLSGRGYRGRRVAAVLTYHFQGDAPSELSVGVADDDHRQSATRGRRAGSVDRRKALESGGGGKTRRNRGPDRQFVVAPRIRAGE